MKFEDHAYFVDKNRKYIQLKRQKWIVFYASSKLLKLLASG